MRKIVAFIVFATFLSCNTEPADPQAWTVNDKGMAAAIDAGDTVATADLPYPFDTLKIEDALLNNHPLEMPMRDFRKLEKPDSSHAAIWYCGSPFNHDEEPLITTLYCSNTTYISNDTSVMIDRFDIAGNTFSVPSRHIVFTDQTTLKDFANYFPASGSSPRTYADEYVRCSLPHGYPFYDDEFIFYFKDDTLHHVVLYWLLC